MAIGSVRVILVGSIAAAIARLSTPAALPSAAAADIDLAYALAAAEAKAAGVESLAIAAAIDPTGITLTEPIAIVP